MYGGGNYSDLSVGIVNFIQLPVQKVAAPFRSLHSRFVRVTCLPCLSHPPSDARNFLVQVTVMYIHKTEV